jgi:hypothetical protein
MRTARLFLLTWGLASLLTGQVDYESQIQPIFDANCAVTGCHVAGHFTGLDLSSGNSYANLVNVVSYGYPPGLRVEPYYPLNSVLYHKVSGTNIFGGIMPPPPISPLDSATVQLIYDWIDEGAHLSSSAYIAGTVEYDAQNYPDGTLKIMVWHNPSAWPMPTEPPLADLIFGPGVDFTTPVSFSIEDPDLENNCCYYLAAVFDADNDGVNDAENWWDQPLDLTTGPIENMTVVLQPLGGGLTISGEVTYDGGYYANAEMLISVWKNPTHWPYPPEEPLVSTIIPAPLDFDNPVPYTVGGPELTADCCYYLNVDFEDFDTPGGIDATAAYPEQIDLSSGPATGINVTLAPVVFGGFSYDFGAAQGYAETDFSDLDGGPELTVEMFIKLHTAPNSYDLFHRDGWGELEWDASATALRFRLEGIGQTEWAASLPTETWIHIAAVYDGTNLSLYVDGQQVSAAAGSGNLATTGNPLRFGDKLDGLMDEIRISDFARFTTNFTPPDQPYFLDAGTFLLYHCDEGGGNQLIDETGNHPAALTGVPTWDPDQPFGFVGDFNLTFTINGDQINLQWDPWTGGDFGRYEVRRSVNPGVDLSADLIHSTTNSNENTYTDVQTGGVWYYRVFVIAASDEQPLAQSSEIMVDMGGEGIISGNVSLDTDYSPNNLYLHLWYPGTNPVFDPPDLIRTIYVDPPFTEYYEFRSTGIVPDSGPYTIRAFFDADGDTQFDGDEPRGEASQLYVPSSGVLVNVDIQLQLPGQGTLSGKIFAPRGGSGDLYIGLWYNGDPQSGPPDIGQGPLSVTFAAPGDFYEYTLGNLAEGSGYTLGVFFDAAGSPNSGIDSCDAGQDLRAEVTGIAVSGAVTVDVDLEECGLWPELRVEPTTVDFAVQEYSREIRLENRGTGTLYYAAGVLNPTADSWLSVVPDSGSINAGERDTLQAIIVPTGAAETARIVVTGFADAEYLTGVGSDTILVTLPAWVDTGPEIAGGSLGGQEAQVGQDLTLQVTVTSVNGVEDVDLFYLIGGDASPAVVSMDEDPGNPGQWVGVIPGADVTDRGLAVTIRAVDDLGYESVSPIQVIQVGFASLPLLKTPEERYIMLSVPGELKNASIGAVLSELGSYDPVQWRLFRWRGGSYVENSGQFVPGNAYWLITRSSVTLNSGPGKSTNLEEFVIPLEPGWNMIGSPYNFSNDITGPSVTFSDPQVEQVLYAYDGNGYSTGTVLEPGRGYWIWSETGATMTIRPLPTGVGGSARQVAADPRGWRARLSAAVNGYHDRENIFGVHPEADDQRDPWDFHEPPVIGDYVQLAFDNREWHRSPGRYSTDIRREGAPVRRWDVSVVTNLSGVVTVTGEDLLNVPPELSVLLVDLDYHTTHDLRRKGPYRFTSHGTERDHPLVLVVGEREAVDREIAGMGLLPQRFELAQNTPNPFNPVTSIRVGLPEAAQVTLTVYNLLGAEVATLVKGEMLDAGYHRVIWNGRDRLGQPAPAGIYFYHLSAVGRSGGQFQDTRKMVLVK